MFHFHKSSRQPHNLSCHFTTHRSLENGWIEFFRYLAVTPKCLDMTFRNPFVVANLSKIIKA